MDRARRALRGRRGESAGRVGTRDAGRVPAPRGQLFPRDPFAIPESELPSPAYSPRWVELFERGHTAFVDRFWNESAGSLYDVVDSDGRPGTADATFRPNQIFAVGGLPYPVLDGARARSVVDAVEQHLWTPLSLRSLAPGAPGYAARYEGDPRARDSVYHQGTVWPWLIGPFVDAWVRVRGGTSDARREARRRLLEPLLRHLDEAGLGHISEIADADPPHTPRGCPFQAWSVGEALRLELTVLAGQEQEVHAPFSMMTMADDRRPVRPGAPV